MTWSRAAVAGGLLVVLAGFAIGTEYRASTSVMGLAQDCGPSISTSWLLSGTPDQMHPGRTANADERRAAAACGPVVHESRVLVVTLMGLGCLVALVGGAAIPERAEDTHRRSSSARS